MDATKLHKVTDLKIKVHGDSEYVEVPSNYSVTPKNQARISSHIESVISYQDPMRSKL